VIAEKADGGMRDALSIFDQATSFCQGNITYDKVIEDLNVLDAENYFKIIDLSIINNVSDIMVLLNSIINKGFDGGLLIQGLAKHVRNVLMAKDPQTLPLLEVSDKQRDRYQEQAKKCETRFLYQALKLMNQCDINYRQSSNKRLLVELTLIEIAQITQPDDGASAGRRPKRLKSLFKYLIQQSQPKSATPQVVAAEAPVSKPSPNNPSSQSSPNPQTTPSSPKTPTNQPAKAKPAAPTTSLKNIGFSWTKLRQDGKSSKINFVDSLSDIKGGQVNDQLFSQEDLELQWMSMCNRMSDKQPQLIGIATRMKNMNPQITEFPQVEVTVENELIKQDMEAIYKSILKTLQLYLHNQQITFTILVSDQKEQTKILSRREQFEEMSKINPAVAMLQQAFDLELA